MQLIWHEIFLFVGISRQTETFLCVLCASVDSWRELSNSRSVFKFKLAAVEGEEDFSVPVPERSKARRVIPTAVKLEAWKRDGGKCCKCGAHEDLHFDHIIPWSKGGSSSTADNIQLLCGKHNLEKHDRIE